MMMTIGASLRISDVLYNTYVCDTPAPTGDVGAGVEVGRILY